MSLRQRLEDVRTGFERPFWIANLSEIFERLSYYAVFAALVRYLHEALGFPLETATSLGGWFGGAVWVLAAFGGAAADWMGFRRCEVTIARQCNGRLALDRVQEFPEETT